MRREIVPALAGLRHFPSLAAAEYQSVAVLIGHPIIGHSSALYREACREINLGCALFGLVYHAPDRSLTSVDVFELSAHADPTPAIDFNAFSSLLDAAILHIGIRFEFLIQDAPKVRDALKPASPW